MQNLKEHRVTTRSATSVPLSVVYFSRIDASLGCGLGGGFRGSVSDEKAQNNARIEEHCVPNTAVRAVVASPTLPVSSVSDHKFALT